MTQPRLLDLFCGAGGAAKGYADAGFEVVGVDIIHQKNYPYEFHQADAMTYPLEGFDVIHASPVCKAYTQFNLSPKEKHDKLIPQVIARLRQYGKPFVVENVAGAASDMPGALVLCGSMFGLRVRRHRLFESNMLLFAPGPCDHTVPPISVMGHAVWDFSLPGTSREKSGKVRPAWISSKEGAKAMGIDWMNRDEVAQAIPPAYTRWIGEQLMNYITQEVSA